MVTSKESGLADWELAETADVKVEGIHTWRDGNRYWQRGR